MSEADYDKLPSDFLILGNFRKFRAMLEQNPNFFTEKKKIQIDDEYMMVEAYSIQIGSRCKLLEKGHRGSVAYIGRVPEVGKGFYVGIRLDEPYGKNDGS
jgi:tubulin-folding cofactor B